MRVQEVGIENCWCKKILGFWWETLMKPTSLPFCQTFWPDKWSLGEGYGGSTLGEKGFKLFQLVINYRYNKKRKATSHHSILCRHFLRVYSPRVL